MRKIVFEIFPLLPTPYSLLPYPVWFWLVQVRGWDKLLITNNQ
jgi:hypothetical protein